MLINRNKKKYIKGIGISSAPPFRILGSSLNTINSKNDCSIYKYIDTFYKDQNIVWTISATASLKIIINLISKRKKDLPTLGIPAYYCNEVIDSIKELCHIKFYDISDPISSIINSSNKNQIDAILICNYFGESDNDTFKNNLKEIYKGIIIYDNAHLSIPNSNIKSENEFIIMSLYKHFPIREGGCLIYSKNLVLGHEINSYVYFLKNIYFTFKTLFQDIFFILKKIIINNSPYLSRIERLIQDPFKNSTNKKVTSKLRNHKISMLSELIIKSPICFYSKTYKENKKARKIVSNLLIWAGISNNDLILKEYGIEINLKEEYIHILEKLNQFGLPLLRWPQLNNKIKINKNLLINTLSLWNQKMYIICNSSIDEDKCGIIKKRIINNINYEINFIRINEYEYRSLKYQIDYSSYLQSESYLKSYSEKCYFYKIKLGGKIIGKFGICYKKKYNFNFYIINRMKIEKDYHSLKDYEIEIIYSKLIIFLKHEFKKGLLILLTIEKNSLDNKLKHYVRKLFKIRGYQTGIINLKNHEDVIKTKMKGRWRNALKKGLKLDLNIKSFKNKEDIFKIFDLYEEDKKKKNYDGINSSLLRKWFFNSSYDDVEFIAFQAYNQNSNSEILLGSIIVCLYENTATYLLAVNDSEKRVKNISNVLLWESIIFAKKKGCLFFDLGGIDQINNPGVSLFKLGLNPTLHEDANLSITIT